uniref:Uncharacterized protein n=1 Tax=Panagrolaimus davidi TaxID=227884 RepID=A0A914P8G1_9BILA
MGCESISLLNVVKKDVVQEFSVIPSANPTDHFTPDQVLMSTSAGLNRIIDSAAACKLQEIDIDSMKVYQTGAQKGPKTLVMAVEAKTETFVYQLIHKLCDESSQSAEEAPIISKILSSSTIYLLPEIPHSQINCHDYGSISPFIPLLNEIFKVIPEIDFVFIIAAGGLKVRFIDSSLKLLHKNSTNINKNNNFGGNGFTNMGNLGEDEIGMSAITNALLSGKKPVTMQIAELYVQNHNQMNQVCKTFKNSK